MLVSLPLLLTVIRQRLFYSVEQDENRHMLEGSTLIFLSPRFFSLSSSVTQPNNIWGCRTVGFENLYRLRETELDLALLLCCAAVINFACECGESCLQSETRQAARNGKRGRQGLLLNSSMVALGLCLGRGGAEVISVGGNWRCSEESDRMQSVQHSGTGGVSQSLVWYSKNRA